MCYRFFSMLNRSEQQDRDLPALLYIRIISSISYRQFPVLGGRFHLVGVEDIDPDSAYPIVRRWRH